MSQELSLKTEIELYNEFIAFEKSFIASHQTEIISLQLLVKKNFHNPTLRRALRELIDQAVEEIEDSEKKIKRHKKKVEELRWKLKTFTN